MKDLIESDKSSDKIVQELSSPPFSGESVILSKGDRIIIDSGIMATVKQDYSPKDDFVSTDQGDIPNEKVKEVSIDGGSFKEVYLNNKGNLHIK